MEDSIDDSVAVLAAKRRDARAGSSHCNPPDNSELSFLIGSTLRGIRITA
jgi:hypothetical protein